MLYIFLILFKLIKTLLFCFSIFGVVICIISLQNYYCVDFFKKLITPLSTETYFLSTGTYFLLIGYNNISRRPNDHPSQNLGVATPNPRIAAYANNCSEFIISKVNGHKTCQL